MSPRALLVACAIVLGAPCMLPAQNWRVITAQRERQSLDTLHVRVEYGAGTVSIGAAPGPLLYDVRLRYDADRSHPERRYDASTRTLTIGGDSAVARIFALNRRRIRLGTGERRQGDSLSLGLARGVPMELTLALGATDSRIDLTDLAVARLNAEIAASDARISFGAPNPSTLRELSIHSAAAGLKVNQLGNARAGTVRVSTAVGDVDLDLSGAWTGEMALDVHAMMGSITVRVPRDVGVRASVSKFFGGVDAPNFTQRDGALFSANWDNAPRKLVINGDVALAGIQVVWRE
jgi:hypothetical protein